MGCSTVKWLCALILALLPLGGRADDFPALYNVSGVDSDDVLNVREAPDADSPVLATLTPDQSDVEVLRVTTDGTWGWVGLPEGNGWVAMRFLIRQETDVGVIPRPMRCLGTEPFWSVTLAPTGQYHATPDGSEPLSLVSEAVSEGGYLAFLADQQGGLWSMTVAKTLCTDGMSDRDYGFAAHVFRQRQTGNEFFLGCCLLVGE